MHAEIGIWADTVEQEAKGDSALSLSIGSALLAYLLSVACALVVAKRSSNWRIRLLAFTVGMLPLCQTVILLGRHQIWLSIDTAEMAESLELLVGALCLTATHLLNKENGNRKNTDARLRVAEATESRSEFHDCDSYSIPLDKN
jgi:hypothetical protein